MPAESHGAMSHTGVATCVAPAANYTLPVRVPPGQMETQLQLSHRGPGTPR